MRKLRRTRKLKQIPKSDSGEVPKSDSGAIPKVNSGQVLKADFETIGLVSTSFLYYNVKI